MVNWLNESTLIKINHSTQFSPSLKSSALHYFASDCYCHIPTHCGTSAEALVHIRKIQGEDSSVTFRNSFLTRYMLYIYVP